MRDYSDIKREIAAVLDGEPNRVARMATIACLLDQAFDDFFWTGFYVVDPDKSKELVVGPYQGTLGCLRIPFGRGVCGAAAQSCTAQVVHDVHAFPGHIACDSRSESEVVVPVLDGDDLFAVLDVDATQLGAFTDHDAQELAEIVKLVCA